jgi:coatomer subunit delta
MEDHADAFSGSSLINAQNKELEATEERKRKAKQLELQRKESARNARAGIPNRNPVYPTYTPPTIPTRPAADTYDSYEAEKNKSKWVVHIVVPAQISR